MAEKIYINVNGASAREVGVSVAMTRDPEVGSSVLRKRRLRKRKTSGICVR